MYGGARPNKVRHLEAVHQAVMFKAQGLSPYEIAQKMGVTRRRVLDLLIKGFSLAIIEDASEIKQQQLMRLDALQASLWDKALKGNFGAMDRILAIMRLRNDIAGLGETKYGPTIAQTLVILEDNGRNPARLEAGGTIPSPAIVDSTAKTVSLLEDPR